MTDIFLEHGATKPQLLELSWQNLENVILEGSQNPIESMKKIPANFFVREGFSPYLKAFIIQRLSRNGHFVHNTCNFDTYKFEYKCCLY